MVKVSALGFRGERSNTALPIKPDRWVWGRVCALRWVGDLQLLVNSHTERVKEPLFYLHDKTFSYCFV